MPTPKAPFAAEFKQQMIELVRAGRTPAQQTLFIFELTGFGDGNALLDRKPH